MPPYPVREESRVRWLMAGSFSPTPAGRCFRVGRGEIAEAMQQSSLKVSAEVSDRLGGETTRTYSLCFEKIPDFKLKNVVQQVPALASLGDLAARLGSGDASKRPSLEEAIAQVVEAVGDGALATALEGLAPPAPPEAEVSPSSGGAAPAEGAVDRIFDQAETKPRDASAAVGSFVKAIRQGGGSARSSSAAVKTSRQARDLVEAAVYGTAADLLRCPEVSRLEAAWRGVKLVLDHVPSPEEIDLIILDVQLDALPEALEGVLPDDPVDWPDAYFLIDPCDDLDRLRRVCELVEGLNSPAVATVSTALLGDHHFGEAAHSADELVAVLGDDYAELRKLESSRWLSLMVNPIVMVAEGTGEARRVLFGSPVFGAAALLSASYRDTGSFAQVVGQKAALSSPGAYQAAEGPTAGMTVPTEDYLSVRSQAELSEMGLAGLGSARNSDKLVLTKWPTLSDQEEPVPFPAQLLTGRIVRFALWVRDQLPDGVDAATVKQVYQDAASVFLFGKFAQGVEFSAQLVELDGQPRQVLVATRIHGALAGIPLSLAFPLPLRA